jgi:hypothetical protein
MIVPMRTSLLLTAAVALALTVLPGCDKKIKHKKLEKNIAKTLKEKTGVAPKSVSCPKDVKEKKGGVFYCTAVDPTGKPHKVEVKMLGDGKVKWQVMSGKPGAAPKTAPATKTTPSKAATPPTPAPATK